MNIYQVDRGYACAIWKQIDIYYRYYKNQNGD